MKNTVVNSHFLYLSKKQTSVSVKLAWKIRILKLTEVTAVMCTQDVPHRPPKCQSWHLENLRHNCQASFSFFFIYFNEGEQE